MAGLFLPRVKHATRGMLLETDAAAFASGKTAAGTQTELRHDDPLIFRRQRYIRVKLFTDHTRKLLCFFPYFQQLLIGQRLDLEREGLIVRKWYVGTHDILAVSSRRPCRVTRP